MNKEEQIGTLVGLDLILSPEHYKEITKLQQENKQLKEQKKQVIEYIKHENFKRNILLGFSEKKYVRNILNNVLEILGDKE